MPFNLMRVLSLAAALFFFTSTALAQVTLTGTITDTLGAPIPGVVVLIEQGLTRQEVTSNADGRFSAANVPAGPVRLSAAVAGFRTFSQVIDLVVGVSRDVPIRLELAGITESVTAVAEGSAYRRR